MEATRLLRLTKAKPQSGVALASFGLVRLAPNYVTGPHDPHCHEEIRGLQPPALSRREELSHRLLLESHLRQLRNTSYLRRAVRGRRRRRDRSTPHGQGRR